MHASEQSRTDVVAARVAWSLIQKDFDLNRLVFIDETGAKTNMTRLHGRSPKSERCHDHAPHGRWNTTTIIGSMRLDGNTACMSLDGAISSEIFQIYTDKILGPSLKPGDIVILDNLSSHKQESILNAIRKRGAHVLFLPPYSPDFNPIEKMWSKVKSVLRKIMARTKEELDWAISEAIKSIAPDDMEGWIRECGYTWI